MSKSLHSRFALAVAMVASVLLAVAGCGKKTPYQLVKVSGTVKYADGTPIKADRLQLVFRPQVTPTGTLPPPEGKAEVNVKTGKFSGVTSYEFEDGVVAGKSKVIAIVWVLPPKGPPQLSTEVPKSVTNPATTPIMIDTSESRDLEIKIPKE